MPVEVHWFNPERQQPRVYGLQFKVTRHGCKASRELFEALGTKPWRVGVTADKRAIIIEPSKIAGVTARDGKSDYPFGSVRLASYLMRDMGIPAGWHPVVRLPEGFRVEIEWRGQHPADVAMRERAGKGAGA